jgi:hypothetical protein
MSTFYTDGQRAVQDQFQTTRMADLLHQRGSGLTR